MHPFASASVTKVWLASLLVSCLGAVAIAQTPARTSSPKAGLSSRPSAKPDSKDVALKDDVIARVGSIDVSAADMRTDMAALGAQGKAALAKDPALLGQTVRALLANRLVLQQALAKKWDKQPAIAAQIERARENAIVELYLQSVSEPPADYPDADDLQKVYDANHAAFLIPRQFEVAQIFVPSPKGTDRDVEEKAKQKVDEILGKLKAPGADFSSIARDNSAAGDGTLGWLQESQIRPEIRTKLMSLGKEDITDPIELDDGWHILKLLDTRAAYTATLPEVRDQLVQQIRLERAKVIRRNFISDLLKQHPPILNELALSSLVGQQTSATR